VGIRPSSWHLQRRRSSAQAFFSSGVTCIPPSFLMWFSHAQQKSATNLSASTDKLGCTLLSKRDKPKRQTRLSDLWRCQIQQWTVVPVSHRITLTCRISNIQLACGAVTVGAIVQGGARRRSQQKTAAAVHRIAAAVFPQQKITGSVLADPCGFPHLSRSPDLWIISLVRPSRISPMTGFRLAQHLPTYSGGTVRDFHLVIYSPAAL